MCVCVCVCVYVHVSIYLYIYMHICICMRIFHACDKNSYRPSPWISCISFLASMEEQQQLETFPAWIEKGHVPKTPSTLCLHVFFLWKPVKFSYVKQIRTSETDMLTHQRTVRVCAFRRLMCKDRRIQKKQLCGWKTNLWPCLFLLNRVVNTGGTSLTGQLWMKWVVESGVRSNCGAWWGRWISRHTFPPKNMWRRVLRYSTLLVLCGPCGANVGPMVSVAAMAMMFCQGPDCGPSFLHMQSAQATLADGNQQRLQNNRGAWRAVWDL